MQRHPRASRRLHARTTPPLPAMVPAPSTATTGRVRQPARRQKWRQMQTSPVPRPKARSPGPPPSAPIATGRRAMPPSPGPERRHEADRAWPASHPVPRALGPAARGTRAAGPATAGTGPGPGQLREPRSTADAAKSPPALPRRSRRLLWPPRRRQPRSWPVARDETLTLPEAHRDRPPRMPGRTWPGNAAYRPGPATARSGRVRTPRRIHARDGRLRASATRRLRCSR